MIRLQRRCSCVGIASLAAVRNAVTLTNKRAKERNLDPTRGTVLSGGSTELLKRRGPGSTKILKVTNKAGRVFEVAVPISKVTHPQKKLVSPLKKGEWVQMDTSYVDVGDFDDDIPTTLAEAIHQGEEFERLSQELRDQCMEYVSMDTEGMVNQPQKLELNSGPDYENEDRALIRRRKWFTLVHQLDAVRTVVWPDEGLSHATDNELEAATIQYETLRAAVSASTFRIAKRQPYEDRPDSDYEPFHLERELRATCASIASAGVTNFFVNGSTGLQRLTTMSSLCRHYNVPFSLCVGGDDAEQSSILEVVDHIRASTHAGDAASHVPQKVAAGLLTSLAQSPLLLFDKNRPEDTERSLRCVRALDFLFSCCSRVSSQDALLSFDGDELVALLQVAVRIRTDNAALFEESLIAPHLTTFVQEFRLHLSVTLNRCRALLYRRSNGEAATTVETEDGLLPIVELQQNADRRHPGLQIHHKLARSFAQGHKEVRLNLRHTARMLKALRQLEVLNELRDGADVTLAHDLYHHLSGCVISSATGNLFTLQDLIFALEAIGHNASHSKLWESNRMLSAVDQHVGGLLHELQSISTLASLVSGFAACDCVPSSLGRIYAVALRLLSAEASKGTVVSKETCRHIATFCESAAYIYSGDRHALGRSIAPASAFSSSSSVVGALPHTIAEKAAAVFQHVDDVELLCAFAHSMLVAGHGDIGASAVQQRLELLSSALDSSDNDAALHFRIAQLLAASHQHICASDADAHIISTMSRVLRAASTKHSVTSVGSPEELLQVLALRAYAQHAVEEGAALTFPAVSCSSEIRERLSALSLSEVAFVHSNFGLLAATMDGGDASALRSSVQAALVNGLASANEQLAKKVSGRKSLSSSFTLESLDHVVRVRDHQPRWGEARWASLVSLQKSPEDESLATAAAQLLGRYMHLVTEVQRTPSPQKSNSFELSHVLRSEELADMEDDLAECGAVLDAANKLSVAEAEFALAESLA